MRLTAALLALVATASSANAFFKMEFTNVLVTERSDPLFFPGTHSMHTHTILGGSNFHPNATYESLRGSECTSARAREDKSSATPTMYFQWANGSFTPVPYVGGSALIYYLFRDNPADKYPIQAFPPGFKMLTGNPFDRTYTLKGNMKDAIGWNCLGSPSPTRQEGSGLPIDRACSANLRGEIRFPSCWDGKNLYKADGSHVAYSEGESGPCPGTHPRRLVTLFYEINFYVQAFEQYRSQAKNPSQPFVLANGDPTGFGWHGEFMNGWDVPLLQKAIETCLSPTSGGLDECKVLDLYPTTHSCKRTTIWNEWVTDKTFPKLPGNNPLTTTAAQAKKKDVMDQGPALLTTKPTTYEGLVPPVGAKVLPGSPTFVTSAKGYRYQGCYADNVSSKRTLSKGLANDGKTVAGCLNAGKAGGYAYVGLEHHGECWASNTAPKTKKLDDGECGLVCDGLASNYCGGSNALAVYKLTSTKAKRHLNSPTFEH
ncbi:hypothetical protein JCM8097_003889 [Rhodosporidiobolus ruineniae]